MGNVFQGWKRKIGCMTLFVAVLLCIGWIRSRSICDEIVLESFWGRTWSIHSEVGGIEWYQWTGRCPGNEAFPSPVSFWRSSTHGYPPGFRWASDCWPICRWGKEINYGPDRSLLRTEGRWGPNRIATGKGFRITYVTLIMPLTMIAAVLILWRPRHRKSAA